MKKIKKTLTALTLVAAAALPPGAAAEVLLTETFNYTAGTNIYGQGGWLRTAHNEDPIKVSDQHLVYDGFIEGGCIKTQSSNLLGQDIMHSITSTPLTTGDLYAAMLINVKALPDKYKPFFQFIAATRNKNEITDGAAAPGSYGYVCVSKANDNGKFTLGLNKTTYSTMVAESQELELNTTYLLVAHWGYVEGTTNDVFEIWINPSKTQGPANATMTKNADPTYGHIGIGILQSPTDGIPCQEMLIGPIKVATTWEELFDGGGGGGGEDPDPTPGNGEITATYSALADNFFLMQHQTYPLSVNVKAKDLTSDITIGGLGSGITASTVTIPAAEAMSAEGYDLTLTLDAASGETISETVTLSSGEVQFSIPINVAVQPVATLSTLATAGQLNAEDFQIYYVTSKCVVTYDDNAIGQKVMYLQDIIGGMAVDYISIAECTEAPFKEGNQISNFYVMCGEKPAGGVPPFMLCPYTTTQGTAYGELVTENKPITPTEMSLADLNNDLERYVNRLVKVSDLTFTEAGGTFETISTPVTSGDASGQVRAFGGSDLIGSTIPESAAVTGISTSIGAAVLTVRHSADVVTPQVEPGLTIEKETLIDPNEYYPIGEDTPFARLTVKATNMAGPTSLWFGGKQRDAFKTDLEEIPAGTGEYTINITFNPTRTGRNEAMLNFDATPTSLSQSISMACLAYDPQNMPQFSVDDSGLTPFSATVGTTQEQTVTIAATNLLDYGTIRVLGQGQGSFIINTTSFLKQGNTTLKITFSPKSEGSFSETIEFTSPKAETVTITVGGTTSGSAPDEDTQGDELSFDTTAPLAKYATDFTGAGENNKPLSLDGWKNVALDGTRAFWSYTREENTMAKVTAYDSKADKESPVEMLLLSPALDFKNCPNRLLQFSIMGELLSDGMTEEFNILYIDPTLPEDERYQVIGGIDIPAGADANGQWRPFVIDLDSQDLADTFFIGFHFKGSRGRNSTAIYYVDDFSWGSETTPFIRVDKTIATTTGAVGQTTKVDDFTVTGLNLTEPISIAFEGADKTHFALSHTQLPADGGQFRVDYVPTERGEHAVYVVLTSAGAPATYITAGGSSTASAIDSITSADDSEPVYYNLRGQRVYRPAPGLYILNHRKVVVK